MHDVIGRTLKGTFEITGRIGEGSMGTVYRGVDRATGRPIALKIMHPGLMREPAMLARFRREATAMRRVRHPNAVEVIAHGVDQGMLYLAMELVEGTDLAERLHAERRMSPEMAARIIAGVCSALAEAHAHGLVHRDVKPENIMLGGPAADLVKLVDFGIAKPSPLFHGEESDDALFIEHHAIQDSIPEILELADDGLELSTAGMLIGSPGYMAPEQWAARPVDGRTDIYACGVLLYQLVTGRLPFEDSNPFMVAQRQLYEEPLAPHEICHEVPLSLSSIILRAMQPAPAERYQTAAELRDALRQFLIERTIAGALGFASTLPIEIMSPLAAGTSLRVVDGSRSTALSEPAPRHTLPLPEPTDVSLERTMILAEPTGAPGAAADPLGDADPPMAPRSVGYSGRATPVPVISSLARASVPPPGRAPAVGSQIHVVLPLCAAFVTLGVVLGLLLFLPLLG